MRTTRCPHCFTDLQRERRTAFLCSYSCGADPTAKRMAEGYGAPVPTARLTTVEMESSADQQAARPAAARCQGCGQPTPVEACPRCTFPLPFGWRSTLTTCVALAGARASGKSVFIAVLERQLERLFESGGKPFKFADLVSAEVFRERYEEPLLRRRELLPPTRAAKETMAERAPLIFEAGESGGHPHRLVIRDVAGEDLESGHLPSPHFDFFGNADGIVFLVDPMRVDGIRQILVGHVDDRKVGAEPLDVLTTLLGKIKSQSNTHRPQLALTLSKFDVLELLYNAEATDWAEIMGNRGAAFLRDPSLSQFAYDDADGRLLHAEALSLLERLGANGLALLAKDAGIIARLFVVSSLGQHGDGLGKRSDRGISPFRCVDPVKWLLAWSHVVPTVGRYP